MQERYTKSRMSFLMNDGTRIEGNLEVFSGSRPLDMLNSKIDKEQFLALYDAKVLMVTNKFVRIPSLLINRVCIDSYIDMPANQE